ncbi:hypothetical protein CE91St43_29610 [Oscillospiraceae bacterium]|nr:hypothetical protein CE91St43_29610 [Oscillospiraceae bacterium]
MTEEEIYRAWSLYLESDAYQRLAIYEMNMLQKAFEAGYRCAKGEAFED